MKIVGIGESVLDVLMRGMQPQKAVPGGSTFNSMISLGRTAGVLYPEVPLVMVTQLGDDKVADMVMDFMRANNVSTAGVKRVQGTQSTVSFAFLDDDNDATYEFFRDLRVPPFEAEMIDFEPGDLVVFGSFFAIGRNTGDHARRLVRAARDAGAIVYYDINFRRSHLADLPVARPLIEENCSLADIVRGSSEDIGYVFGSSDAAEVYEKHLSRLCGTYICTRGAGEVEVFSPGVRAQFPVAPVDTVSTIGAGDSFNAGIVFGLLRGGFSRKRVAALTQEDWTSLVGLATRFSANVCRSVENYVDKDFLAVL